MTAKKQTKAEIPTETTEIPNFEDIRSSTVPEPTHKNILDSVYNLSDFFKNCIVPIDSRIAALDNKFDKMQEIIRNLSEKQGEINGKLNIILCIGVAIIGFLLYQNFITIKVMSENFEKLNATVKSLKLDEINQRLEKHQDKIDDIMYKVILQLPQKNK